MHDNDGVWIVSMYQQQLPKNKNIHQLVECQVQVNFSCSLFFLKKYELMENPQKVVVLSSQIYEALRFGFNGFFFSSKKGILGLVFVYGD